MKIKEKLAKQNLLRIMKKNRLWSNPNNDTVERAVCVGYEEGFDKAREMADKPIDDLISFLEDKDDCGECIRPICQAQFNIRLLGEYEAP